MQAILDTKTRILMDIYSKYCAAISPLQSVAELETPSLEMMQQIIDLIKPNHIVRVISNPQEEQKEDFWDVNEIIEQI